MTALYDIRDLNRASTMVFFTIEGKEVTGFVRFTPGGKPRYHVGSLRRHDKLPNEVVPEAWRPASPAIWDTLPLPLKEAPQPAPVTPPRPDLYHEPYDPLVRLGRPGEPPESQEEVKARAIRFIWTSEVMEHDPGPKRENLWPRQCNENIIAIERYMRRMGERVPGFREDDYDHYHVVTDDRALMDRFKPEPRDVSDYEHKDGPRSWPRLERGIFQWRAARPIYSWGQIAEHLRQPEETVIEAFEVACRKIYETVRRRAA